GLRTASYLRQRRTTVGVALLLVSAAGLVTVAIFRKTDWATGPSLGGTIHRIGAAVAFLALPVAVVVLLTGRWRRGAPGRLLRRWGLGCAVVAPLWLIPVAVAVVTAGRAGRWWLTIPLGLIE